MAPNLEEAAQEAETELLEWVTGKRSTWNEMLDHEVPNEIGDRDRQLSMVRTAQRDAAEMTMAREKVLGLRLLIDAGGADGDEMFSGTSSALGSLTIRPGDILAPPALPLDPWPFASIGTARHTTGSGGGSFDPRPGYSQNREDYLS